MRKIIQSDIEKEKKILRGISKPVEISNIKSEKIQQIIKDMQNAMHKEPDAVAIAAPQVGELIQIFIIAGWVFDAIKRNKGKIEEVPSDTELKNSSKDMIFINPRIIKLSKKTNVMEEGCLSVRFVYGKVKRAEKATIEAYDENGQKFTKGGSGIIAQIYQHETDHLTGILFTDKATDLEKMPPSYVYGREHKK